MTQYVICSCDAEAKKFRDFESDESMAVEIALQMGVKPKKPHGLIAYAADTKEAHMASIQDQLLYVMEITAQNTAIWYEEITPLIEAIDNLDLQDAFSDALSCLNQSLTKISDICEDSYDFSSIETCMFNTLDCYLENYHNDLDQSLQGVIREIYEFKEYGDE